MASRVSTLLLQENPNELCDRLKLLLRERKAGNNSDIVFEEIIAKRDKSLEYKCVSTKQHRLLLPICLN